MGQLGAADVGELGISARRPTYNELIAAMVHNQGWLMVILGVVVRVLDVRVAADQLPGRHPRVPGLGVRRAVPAASSPRSTSATTRRSWRSRVMGAVGGVPVPVRGRDLQHAERDLGLDLVVRPVLDRGDGVPLPPARAVAGVAVERLHARHPEHHLILGGVSTACLLFCEYWFWSTRSRASTRGARRCAG